MKKILALLMAAMMVLSAVSALAAGSPSPKPIVVNPVVEELEEAVVTVLEDQSAAEALAAEMSAADYDAAVLKQETQDAITALLPENVDIKELVASELVALAAIKSDKPVDVTFGFTTEYTADQTVINVLKVEDTEIILDNTVNDDGTLTVAFTVDALAAMKDNTGVMIVLSK